MLIFPHHPKVNFNCGHCFCVGVGYSAQLTGKGYRKEKGWLEHNIKAPQYGKSKSVLFYGITRFRGLYDLSVEILFASQHFSHNHKSYSQIKNIPSKPLPISRAYLIL